MTLMYNGNVDINRTEFDISQVGEELRRIYAVRQDKTIFIRADAKVPYSKVIELIDIAKGAGVDTTGLIPEYFTEEEN